MRLLNEKKLAELDLLHLASCVYWWCVRTKAVMQCELCDYNKRVSQHYESLDQLAIQADLWRSKFVATR